MGLLKAMNCTMGLFGAMNSTVGLFRATNCTKGLFWGTTGILGLFWGNDLHHGTVLRTNCIMGLLRGANFDPVSWATL